MSTLNEFYPRLEVECPHCRQWALSSLYHLVGDEGFECPGCGMVDTAIIPRSRPITGTTVRP